ncbi:MAG: putative bifunctional diguanylate cyclase/phosphodiesterase [Bacillota bacterium]
MPSALFYNLETLVVIFTLASLAVYVFFAYYEFKTSKSTDHMQFVNNMIAFSILWIFECLLMVYYYLFKEISQLNNLMETINILALLIMAAIILAAADFFRKRNIKPIPLIPVNVTLLVLALLFITLEVSIYSIFNMVLAAYTIVCVLFAVQTLKYGKKVTRIGLVYTICGAFVILVVNTLKGFWGYRFVLTLDLAISLLITVGFFMYYIEIYSIAIREKMDCIGQKNQELTLADKIISNLAYVDQVTQIKNIHQLQEDIQRLNIFPTYFLIINLRNFKMYNNVAGYEKGNNALLNIADKLKEALDSKEEIYRFYSDKFIIIHPGNRESTIAVVENILRIFQNNIFCTVPLMPYIGITDMTDGQKLFDRLIQELELTSHYVKEKGIRYAFFNEQWYYDFQNKLSLEMDLRNAVENRAWQIYFQPKISLADNSLLGAEALIRWKNLENQVSPQVFIPLSEQLGLIQDIGKYVIETTFEYLCGFNKLISRNLNISINLSPYQLMEKDFPEYIESIMKGQAINPKQITFEITESALMSNLDRVNDAISRLKKMGFHFSLDDFGTGYSSLNYFSKLNLDEIKFDRTFTNSLPFDEKNKIILANFTKMAKKLGIHIVIEGVETKEQYECIKSLGCDGYQGYYYSRPVPYDDFISLAKAAG